ncbi:hypothetical protein NDU88_003346 [Pleurodeles waltl]|uniref:Uncharacterized protein n=1 Tax=Pleurodeles waltl TaxID=8319 RepID=A0AAV7NJM1_PLEWA|nr:hypothetical protein NDU88_003346 [Pleurodeles waltl]
MFTSSRCHFESSCPSVSKSLFQSERSTGLTVFILMIWGKAEVANQMLVCVRVLHMAPRTESEWSPIHEAFTQSARIGQSWARAPRRANKVVFPMVLLCRWKDINPINTIPTKREFYRVFQIEISEREETRPNPTVEKKKNLIMELMPMRNGTEQESPLDPMTRKHFFEEKQLLTLRAQH